MKQSPKKKYLDFVKKQKKDLILTRKPKVTIPKDINSENVA